MLPLSHDPCPGPELTADRRQFLTSSALGFGSLAFTALGVDESAAARPARGREPAGPA